MKKNYLIIILLAVLAIGLGVLYFLLKNGTNPQEQQTASYFTIKTIDTQQIDRVVLQSGEFTGEFLKSNGGWIREEEGVFPVKQSAVDNIVSIIAANLRAFSKVENPAALSEYGLDNPLAALKLYNGESLLLELLVGRKHPSQEKYYMKIAGDDNVYIVSDNYYRYLVLKREDFLEDVRLPYIEDKLYLREIKVSGEDIAPLHAVYDENNPYDYSSTKSFRWYFTEPFEAPVNADLSADTWELVIDRYRTVSYENLVAFRPSDYKRYGLDEPYATVYVRYTNAAGTSDQEYKLYIGNQNDAGLYYARVEGVDWVFQMKSDTVDGLIKTDVSGWYYKTIFFPGVNVFEKLVIKTPDKTWEITSKTGSEEETVYIMNGKDLPDDVRSAWVSQFLLLKYKGMTNEEISGAEVLSFDIVVKNPETHASRNFTFYEKNESVYLVAIDGIVQFTADVRDVNEFIELMKSFK